MVLALCFAFAHAWDDLELHEVHEREQRDEQAARERRERRSEDRRREWHVRAINFEGNATYRDKELLSLMELKPKWPSYRTRFTNFRMNSDLAALRAFYRARGFEYADVRLDRIVSDTARARLRVYIAIDEGEQLHVNEVNVSAERFVPRPAMLRRMATRHGAPLTHSDVRRDIRAMDEALGRQGFLEAAIEPVIFVDTAENLANVTFSVREGPKVQAGNITLSGNDGIADWVIRRELAFSSGDTLNLRTLKRSERRLYETGLFSYVEIRPEFDTARAVLEHPDSTYDIHVRLSESEFLRLQGGAGYSTDEGFRVSGSATYRNMFRFGHGLTLTGKLSQISQLAEAVYAMPRFFYLPFQFDTRVYYNRYDNRDLYQGEFSGFRFSVGQQTDNQDLFYQVWLQREWVRWITAPADDLTGPDGVPDDPTESIGLDFIVDTRNDLFNPGKGNYFHIGLEVAGIAGIFGENSNQFYKATFDYRHYFSRRSRYFLSMAARTGVAIPYGRSEVVPVQSRFHGGGSNTVRGFAVNRLATTLPNNDPLSGNFYTFFNLADIRFPIYGWVNGAVFLDAGNVWHDYTEIVSARSLIGDLRWSAGPGLRVDTPIKLIARLDLGFKLDKRPGESAWELHFDLGQPF
ncbi:MAG: BamA/TamA family outer membrane protein [Chitinispirillales bacterium]|jgi:outer membrane protein assembly complex protein YaeT|nr:BamA/TamA family outer membrane protein [Chitinispirillales bacterium]